MNAQSNNPSELKVLFISRSYPPVVGGMEKLSFHLTTSIKCRKKIIALKKWNRMHIIWFLPLAFILTLFKSKKFDIVHFSDAVTASLTIPLKILLKNTIFVSNVHGLDINFQNKCGVFSKAYGLYIRLLKKKQPHLWIANSRHTRDMAHNSGLKNVKIIHPGINPDEFYDKLNSNCLADILKSNYDQKNIYILTLGRLTRRKGQRWFVEKVLPKLPGHIHYIVAGKPYVLDGKDEGQILKETVVKTGLENRVVFIEEPSDETRLKLLCACDLFLMPNLPVKGDVEGFGIVALEAAVSGTIVVASALEGIKDAIAEGITGYLIEPGNENDFIKKIEELVFDVESLNDRGEAARKYVQNKFDMGNISQSYLQAFAELKQSPQLKMIGGTDNGACSYD